MGKRQVFWWAASIVLLVGWGLLFGLWIFDDGLRIPAPGQSLAILLVAIATTSHWLNRPGAADTELQELTMEAKKARLRSEITGLQQGQAQSNGLPIRHD